MNHTGTSSEDSNREQDKQRANGLEQRTPKDREAVITSPESCVLPTDMWTMNFQIFKLVLEKAEEAEIKLPTSTGSSKQQEFQKKKKQKAKNKTKQNICFCFIDYAKDFDCVDQNELWKILKEMGIPDNLSAS